MPALSELFLKHSLCPELLLSLGWAWEESIIKYINKPCWYRVLNSKWIKRVWVDFFNSILEYRFFCNLEVLQDIKSWVLKFQHTSPDIRFASVWLPVCSQSLLHSFVALNSSYFFTYSVLLFKKIKCVCWGGGFSENAPFKSVQLHLAFIIEDYQLLEAITRLED